MTTPDDSTDEMGDLMLDETTVDRLFDGLLAPEDVPPEYVEDHLRGMSAAALLTMTIPPMQEAIAGVIPEGLGVIGAPPKAGKSLLMYQAAVELVTTGSGAFRRTARRYSLCGADADDAYQRSLERLSARVTLKPS